MNKAIENIPNGYKKTEIGVIPVDWEVVKLVDICQPSPKRINPITCQKNYKCIELEHLSQETGRLLGYTFTENIKSQKSLFYKNDVLFGKLRPYLKKFYFAKFDGVCTTEIWVLKSKKNLENNWLYYLMQSNRIIEVANQSTGTKMPRAEWNVVGETPIPLPPLPEQKAIATVLSDTDSLIQALEKNIAKKQLIKKGAMQELLAPKEGWETKTLGEIAEYRRGSFPQPYGWSQWYDDNKGMPFVQVFDVDKNMKLKSTTKQKISDLAKSKSVFVKQGSVVLTIQGSIGRIAVTQYDAYVDRTLLIFTKYTIPMNVILFSYLVQEKFRIEKENAPGGIIKTITKEALSKFIISFPKSIEDQTRIAQILSDMDAEIEALEKKLAKYKQIKQGLMQVLLTGKIRLV